LAKNKSNILASVSQQKPRIPGAQPTTATGKRQKKAQTAAAYLAKKDTLSQYFNDTTTTYYIYAGGENLAKMDALSVKIITITPR
jgi:hypothetical protein